MQTDELIRLLATGLDATPPAAARRRLLRALALSLPLAGLAMALTLGVQEALGEVMMQPMFWVKLTLPAALLSTTGLALSRLARPGAALGRTPVYVALPLLAIWALALAVLLGATPAARPALLYGETWQSCPWNIAGLSVPGFACALWALRGLAPTRLRLAGATAGLFAGALGAFVYAFHCPELAAPFIGTWYVLGMAIPAVIGALLGPRLLRWD